MKLREDLASWCWLASCLDPVTTTTISSNQIYSIFLVFGLNIQCESNGKLWENNTKSTKLNESRHNPAPICRTPVWLHNLESTFTLNLYININNFVGLDNLRCVWLQGGEIVSLVWLLHQWMTNLKFVYFNQVNRE